jgi:hypothetical protein
MLCTTVKIRFLRAEDVEMKKSTITRVIPVICLFLVVLFSVPIRAAGPYGLNWISPAIIPEQSQTEQELVAKRAGRTFVEREALINPSLSKWDGANLGLASLYHDLDGQVNAFMFAIQNGGKVLGHVLVGSSSYSW